MRFKKPLLFLIIISFLLLISSPPLAQDGVKEDNFLFLDHLQPGMTGIGKTVIKGDAIESFGVQIVDIVDKPGQINDLILVRASGDVIARSGGIAAGMSGSPVYVNDKLIGAISAAATFDVSKNPIAVVTPIQNMLKLIPEVRHKLTEDQKSSIVSSIGKSTSQVSFLKIDNEQIRFKKLLTFVWVWGMGDRAFEYLKRGTPEEVLINQEKLLNCAPTVKPDFQSALKSGLQTGYPIKLHKLGSWGLGSGVLTKETDASTEELKPGASVGVLMANGDVSIGALGTLTYREENIVLAFGHPFLFNGSSELFLTKAHILDTVESLEFPFKYGVPREKIGAIYQDRTQGLAGAVGAMAKSIDLNVQVKDVTRKQKKEFSIQITRDPKLAPQLIYSTLLETVDTTLNRIGKGSLTISYQIRGDGLPKPLNREDIFYSFEDVAPTGPLQVAQAIFVLIQNEFQDPGITSLHVQMEIEKEVKTARIKSLKVDKEEYEAGEVINYTVVLKPFRGKELEVTGKVKIPQDFDRSSLSLIAFGGSRKEENEDKVPEFENLEELIEAMETLKSNNYLTVEILGMAEETKKKESDQEVTSRQIMQNKVILGEKTAKIKVKPGEEKKPEEQKKKKEEDEDKCKFPFYCP